MAHVIVTVEIEPDLDTQHTERIRVERRVAFTDPAFSTLAAAREAAEQAVAAHVARTIHPSPREP